MVSSRGFGNSLPEIGNVQSLLIKIGFGARLNLHTFYSVVAVITTVDMIANLINICDANFGKIIKKCVARGNCDRINAEGYDYIYTTNKKKQVIYIFFVLLMHNLT